MCRYKNYIPDTWRHIKSSQ